MPHAAHTGKLATLLGGVVLASAGFALGSQPGDGTAVAAKPTTTASPAAQRTTAAAGRDCDRRGGRRDLSGLATALGVSEARLREALRAVRPDAAAREDRRAERIAALAKALGVREAKVREALEDRAGRSGRRGGRARHLAQALGVSKPKVREAFATLREQGRPEREARREAFATALGEELGIDGAKVEDALGEFRVGPGRHGRGRP